MLHDHFECRAVKKVGGVDDFRLGSFGRIACGEGSMDFAGADRVDDHSMTSHPIQDCDIAASLLCVTDHIELGKLGDSLFDYREVINVEGSAKLLSEFFYGNR